MHLEQLTSSPIFFEKNRVYRVYLGGKGIAKFCDLPEEEDGFFPEEWIASSVKAINPKYFGERDGVARPEGTELFFDDLLREYPENLLGGRKYDCLVKTLTAPFACPCRCIPQKNLPKNTSAHLTAKQKRGLCWQQDPVPKSILVLIGK